MELYFPSPSYLQPCSQPSRRLSNALSARLMRTSLSSLRRIGLGTSLGTPRSEFVGVFIVCNRPLIAFLGDYICHQHLPYPELDHSLQYVRLRSILFCPSLTILGQTLDGSVETSSLA